MVVSGWCCDDTAIGAYEVFGNIILRLTNGFLCIHVINKGAGPEKVT